jgi:hypothetical protein
MTRTYYRLWVRQLTGTGARGGVAVYCWLILCSRS